MSAAVWSWIAAVVSVGGLWLAGINPRMGWVYGLGAQVVWALYGVMTQQPGMIALSVVFTLLYVRNLHRWRGTVFRRAAAASDPVHCVCHEGGKAA